jgi:hypothetical protein
MATFKSRGAGTSTPSVSVPSVCTTRLVDAAAAQPSASASPAPWVAFAGTSPDGFTPPFRPYGRRG